MVDRWNLLKDVKWITDDTLEAQIYVPNDSVWFAGHFPGEPILPGIALVHLACEAILKEAENKGESVKISFLKRVRFTGPVRPGDTLLLSLSREDGNMEKIYNFKTAVGEKVICSGQVAVAKNT